MKTNLSCLSSKHPHKIKGLVVGVFLLCCFQLSAQKQLTIEWEYTVVGGCTRMPMDIRLLGLGGDDIRIYKDPAYSPGMDDSSINYLNQKNYISIGDNWSPYIAVGYKNDQGLCPGLLPGRPCYSGGLTNLSFSLTDFCLWGESQISVCGLSNFKIRINISPISGTPIIQKGTPKATYCPGETITYEVPCNLKGRGFTFRWYAESATGTTAVGPTSSETFTVGEGFDYTPTPGVSTYLYVIAQPSSPYSYSLRSSISPSFRYGAHAPTATINPRPPRCSDGDDWSVEITNASSTDAAVTSFKANIFHSLNASTIPDGYLTFNGSTGMLTKDNIESNRDFAPGTVFRMSIQNDFNVSSYGVCETVLPGTYTIPNTPKIAITENTAAHKDLTCFNTLTGEFQVNVSNGDGNYTIKLNDVVYPIKSGSPAHQPIVENLDGGAYTIKLSDTYCEADPISITLAEPSELTAAVSIEKPLDCANSTDGQLRVNITGGLAPYTINWSNGNTSALATGFGEGTHSVVVRDQGCPNISRSQLLDAPDPIVITLTGTSPKCPNGTDGNIQISNIQNAPGTLGYLWNTGETSYQLLNVGKGNYNVTVSSTYLGKTCSGTASSVLSDPIAWTATLIPSLTFNGSAISCNGEDDGRLDVVVSNDLGQTADAEYYTWSTGENGASKKYVDGLSEGTYQVTIRYNSMCEVTSSYTLLDPEPLLPSIVPNSNYNGQLITCYNASDASLRAATTGGTGLPSAYTYTWSTGQTGAVASNLGAGSYNVIVKDVNGCSGTNTYVIDNPDPVETYIASASDYTGFGVSCFGAFNGYATAFPSGGTESFTYLWSDGKTTPTINNVGAGSYMVTVRDSNGCSTTETHVITEPTAVALGITSKEDISCFGGTNGSITLSATGGTNQFEYSRNNSTWQTADAFGGLPIGTYQLYARDQNGCIAQINETLGQPSKISIGFSNIEPAFCSDPVGKATGVATGGVGSFAFDWRLDGQSNTISNSSELLNVAAGIYRLIVSDGNNCLAENTVSITSTDGAKSIYSSIDTKCFDSADGSATLTITEGDGPFAIKWPDGQNSLEGLNLKKGSYDVQITDAHNCTVIETISIDGPDAMDVFIQNVSIPTCNTFCDGVITLNAMGGTGSYVFEWNNSAGATQTQLCAGKYPVLVRDANGCLALEEVTMSEPDPIRIDVVNATLATCRDGCDGSLEVLATGGNGSYQYEWEVGGSAPNKTNICAGDYIVNILDQKGCRGVGIVQLANTPELPLDLGGGATLCVGQSYTLNVGNNWSSVQWGSNAGLVNTNPVLVLKEAGNYWVDVVDDKGCTAHDTFLLETSYDLLQASFLLSTEAIVGDTVVMIDISWPLPESIQWNYPLEMEEIDNTGDIVFGQFQKTGTYDISLTAHLGECVDRVTKTITILEPKNPDEGGRLGYESFVRTFTIHPNPNDGSFDVGVELMEESEITLSVWSTLNSKLIGKLNDEGSDHYQKHIDLRPLASGSYLLRLDHARGKEYLRFIVY